MKQDIFIAVCTIFLIGSLFPLHRAEAQTPYNVPITLSIDNAALNRSIAIQWSGRTGYWTGTTGDYGLYYELHLDQQPIITLSTNQIKLKLTIWIKVFDYSSDLVIIPHKDYTIETILAIPPTTINTDAIYAQYTNLNTDVTNALNDLNDQYYELRGLVAANLAELNNWIIYKGKMINIPTVSPLNKVTTALYWEITPSYSNTVTPEGVLDFKSNIQNNCRSVNYKNLELQTSKEVIYNNMFNSMKIIF